MKTELISPETRSLIPVSTIIGRSRVEIVSAYRYLITVSNIGTNEVEKPEIDITFDAKTRIYKTKIDSQYIAEDKIMVSLSNQRINYCRIVPEYINSGHNLIIVITTLNNEIGDCSIDVRGAGVFHRRRSNSPRSQLYIFLSSVIVAILLGLLTYLASKFGAH